LGITSFSSAEISWRRACEEPPGAASGDAASAPSQRLLLCSPGAHRDVVPVVRFPARRPSQDWNAQRQFNNPEIDKEILAAQDEEAQ
jgi:hypothetical protein